MIRLFSCALVLLLTLSPAHSASDSLFFSFRVAASPLQAFNGMVVDWQIRQWSGTTGVAGEVVPGGAWRWTYGSGDLEEGIYTTIEPMRLLGYSFLVDSQATQVEIRFEPEADSTVISIRHWNFGSDSLTAEARRNHTALRWYDRLPRLQAYLNGLPGGYLARPRGEGPFPAVILLHDVFGLNRTTRAFADSLAASGYYAVCADMFRGEVTGVMSQAERFSELVDDEAAFRSAQRALTFASARGDVRQDRMGTMGMGYGGYLALRMAAAEPSLKGCVVWYPHKSLALDSARRITCRVLGVFGSGPSLTSGPNAQAFGDLLTQAGVVREVVTLPRTQFGDPAYGGSYSRGTTEQAWRKSLRFLDQNLRP